MADLSTEQKLDLIKRDLQEVLREDIIREVLEVQKRDISIYWGTAPTGRPHCGYFVGMVKIAHFLRAGCHVKVLLADLHAFLDNMKAPLELVAHRADYYGRVVRSILKSIGVPIDKLTFVKGSEYQLGAAYTMDIFRLSSIVTEHDARKAGAEVVKQVASPLLSGLIYPLMQALDEEHLGVDAQFGGVDQRKIFTLAAEVLPKLQMKERCHLMNKMVPGLAGGKMSASDPNSKIDLLDPPEVVKAKLKKAVCAPKEVEGNGVLSFIEYVIFPVIELKAEAGKTFHVPRPDKWGGPLDYTTFEEVKKDFVEGTLSPPDLKAGLELSLNELLAPIQKEYNESPEWQACTNSAYPPPEEPKKKKKEKKNKGTGYPGAKKETDAVKIADGAVKPEDAGAAGVATSAEEAMEKLEVKEN